MNYITCSHAVSLFPFSTFRDRRTFVCQDIEKDAAHHRTWIDKYCARGFEVVTARTRYNVDTVPAEMRFEFREVGDDLSWVLPLRRGSTC